MDLEKFDKTVQSLVKKRVIQNEYGTVKTYTILPINEKGILTRRGTDDKTYQLYPELINAIPRGCSDFEWKDGGIESLRGLQKFSGTTPTDEDPEENQENTDIQYFSLKEVQEWGEDLEVTFQKKENGKFLIFRVIWKNDIPYLFGGSKNVHVVVPLRVKIPINSNELHFRILSAVQDDLIVKDDNWLKIYIGDKSIIGEYVDGQHIVYVETPYVVYFNMPIKTVTEILPSQKILPTANQLHYLRTLHGVEGVVIVYRNRKTGQIYRHKHKTVWYILLRVMRECLCRASKNKGVDFLHNCIIQRFQKRSEDFLNLTPDEKREWRDLSGKFINWLLHSSYQLSDLSFTSKIGMAKVWKAFSDGEDILFEKKEPDINDLVCNIVPVTFIRSLVRRGIKCAAILRGPSGSGKSTLARLLSAEMESSSIHSTDKFFTGQDGVYKFDPKKLKEYHELNLREFQASDKLLAIVDNTNLVQWEYLKYRESDRVIVIVDTKKQTAQQLASQTTHNVPFDKIVQMNTKYAPVCPNYYGVFFPKSICPEAKQTTPLHVTYLFLGGKDCQDLVRFFGKEVKVKIVSKAENMAGKKFNVELPADIPYMNSSRPHITLETYTGKTAKDVGADVDISTSPYCQEVVGVFGAYY